jgi:hypothetical protein
MTGGPQAPTHGELIEDLRSLRERGLVAIRDMGLSHLRAAAALHMGTAAEGEVSPAALERLLRSAIAQLGGGDLELAAEYTFGTRPGMRDTVAGTRRRRAAEVYGVTPERFRKAQERTLISQVADAILDLSIGRPPSRSGDSQPSPAVGIETESEARRSLSKWLRPLHADGNEHVVTLHVGPVEVLADIDIIVSSESTYLEGSQIFKPSISAALRLACATRDEVGGILDDPIRRELTEWMEKNGRRGLPVAVGTVVSTSPGQLRQRNIRRIYHAAIVSPRLGSGGYDVKPEAIPLAIRNVFQIARKESGSADPPFRSVCFPLFGSGSGGLLRQESLSLIWASLEQELADDEWDIHLLTRGISGTELDGWHAASEPGTRA